VPARVYTPLAEVLSEAGLAVLTFDYRGIADSRRVPPRQEGASMADWGRLDVEGALSTLAARLPTLPLLLLGHSVGGQLLGLAPTSSALRGALLVGAQHGYWKHWKGLAQARMWVNWHVLLPGLTGVLGYAPMRVLRMGENLPAEVARQWARWGRHPEHFLSQCSPAERERYVRLGFPIRCYHFTDDDFAPLPAVKALAAVYQGAATEVLTRAPQDVGASAIGHFGWLKPRFRETLWREMAGWLLARADAVSGRVLKDSQASLDAAVARPGDARAQERHLRSATPPAG
jgi:predicted alpha/beta hydrolase